MCPKPFSWAKNKRKLFSDGKSRGPVLARVALKIISLCYIISLVSRIYYQYVSVVG